MPDLPISTVLVGALALMLFALSLPVSLRRFATKTPTGLGNDPLLARLIRMQGNFVEYAPLGALAVVLVEAGGAGERTVWTLAGLLVAGRIVHAAGMAADGTAGRALGMVLTYASLLTAAAQLLT